MGGDMDVKQRSAELSVGGEGAAHPARAPLDHPGPPSRGRHRDQGQER
jgi:hypothetical protein